MDWAQAAPNPSIKSSRSDTRFHAGTCWTFTAGGQVHRARRRFLDPFEFLGSPPPTTQDAQRSKRKHNKKRAISFVECFCSSQ